MPSPIPPEGPAEPPVVTICEGMSAASERDACYRETATERNDARLCPRIANSTLKLACFAVTTNEPSMCEGVAEETLKEECLRLCEE